MSHEKEVGAVLIQPRVLAKVWDCRPDVVIHIGAHEAEELDDYIRLGWGSKSTVWVDALETKTKIVAQKIANLRNHSVIQVALSDTNGKTVTFNEANNGQSSSLLNFGTHADSYPDIEFIKNIKW
jgi:hypothetical protein